MYFQIVNTHEYMYVTTHPFFINKQGEKNIIYFARGYSLSYQFLIHSGFSL